MANKRAIAGTIRRSCTVTARLRVPRSQDATTAAQGAGCIDDRPKVGRGIPWWSRWSLRALLLPGSQCLGGLAVRRVETDAAKTAGASVRTAVDCPRLY